MSSGTQFDSVGIADERQIKRLIGDWRNGRADRNIWQALSSSYTALFSVSVLGAMLVSAILDAQQKASTCDAAGCLAARSLLPWAAVAGVLTLTLVASQMFGPVLASAAEGFWLLDSPMDRRRLLSGRLFLAIGLAGALCGIITALVAALTGQEMNTIGIWAAAGALGAAGLTALAAVEQTFERRVVVATIQWLLGLASLFTLVILVASAAGWTTLDTEVEQRLAIIVAGIGLVLLAAAGVIAFIRLGAIRRQRLTSAGALLTGLQGAAFALEFALMRDILVQNRSRRKGHVRPTRGSGLGVQALVMRDVQRLWRNPITLIVLAASAVVPYAVEALGLQALNVAISSSVLMMSLIPFMNTLRVLSRSKGIERLFPFGPTQTRQSSMVVPGILAILWAAGTIPAFAGVTGELTQDAWQPVLNAGVTGLAGFLGAVRWVSAKPASYSGPLVATGTGALPPGLMFSMMRGFDIIALITLPLLFGLPSFVSILIGAIAFAWLSSGLDREALMAQSEEQRRALEEEKNKRASAKEKIKVRRSR